MQGWRMKATPANIPVLLDQAVRLHQSGERGAAESIYRQILALDPQHCDALHLLGLLDRAMKRLPDALKRLSAAARLRPDVAVYQADYALGLRDAGQLDDALAAAQRAVALDPRLAPAHYTLATICQSRGELDPAWHAAHRAADLHPQSLQFQLFAGNLAMLTTRSAEFVAAGERAVRIAPNDPSAHWNLALALLQSGDFARGWREFEWRLQLPSFAALRRGFPQPVWCRQDISNSTLLLHCEGGFGDALQFVRYLPLATQRVATVILECPPPLHALFARLPGPHQFIQRGQPLPAFDVHCPLQSLPFNLGTTTMGSIPTAVPYLHADPARSDALAAQLGLGGGGARGFTVGLAWAGSANPRDRRSRTLDVFAPLAAVPDVRFVALQKGPAAEQATNPPPALRGRVIDASRLLSDFADTADVIASLDLVITVDTSVAHLAGALSRPVWTLLPRAPDFRWMLGRADSPWYPTMRLFRQSDARDWTGVMVDVATALRERASTRAG
jgi:tetratricopeptide (TPR) repeat protein